MEKQTVFVKEEWREIKGYEGMYEISNLGRVKSLSREIVNERRSYVSREIILALNKSQTGYLLVALNKQGKRKTFKVHKLVAIAFLNHTPNGSEKVIDHINGDKLDNRVCNLEIVSCRENSIRASKNTKGVGVTLRKGGYYYANIQINGKTIYLGRFDRAEDASLMYNKALSNIPLFENPVQFRKLLAQVSSLTT